MLWNAAEHSKAQYMIPFVFTCIMHLKETQNASFFQSSKHFMIFLRLDSHSFIITRKYALKDNNHL